MANAFCFRLCAFLYIIWCICIKFSVERVVFQSSLCAITKAKIENMELPIKGKEFVSLEAVETFIKNFEKLNFIQLNKKECKKLDSQCVLKKYPLRVKAANATLLYYSITYGCVKGGLYKSKKENKRSSSTFKENCPMFIRFNLSLDGQHLKIVDCNLDHTHEVCKDLFEALPRQRRLSDNEKDQVLELMSLKCNKKLLKSCIKRKTGKIVTLKDLSNLKSSKKTDNELMNAISLLQADAGSIVEVIAQEDNTLEGIYYQSTFMKQSYEAYPEVLLCDATFKLNNLRMPLYIFLVINGNGQGEVVATFLLSNETKNNITSMCEIFKKHNSCWIKTVSVMTDKDFKERSVFANEFTNAEILLCAFHTLKTFRTQITTEKMNITAGQRETCLKILQDITYSKNEDDYFVHYEILKQLKLKRVLEYYNKNWHDIRHEWVRGLVKQNITFNIVTTNHLESFNQKIKQIVTKLSTLTNFYKDFLTLLDVIRDERKIQACMLTNKLQVTKYLQNSPENLYSKFVTEFAFSFIIVSLKNSVKISDLETEVGPNGYIIRCPKDGLVETNVDHCNCTFFKNMMLPCAHIFYVRKKENLELFDENLIKKRFVKHQYAKQQMLYNHLSSNEAIDKVEVALHRLEEPRKPTTAHAKYKKIVSLCDKIANALSECGAKDFEKNYKQLQVFYNLATNRKPIIVLENSIANADDANMNENVYEVSTDNLLYCDFEYEENNIINITNNDKEETENDNENNLEKEIQHNTSSNISDGASNFNIGDKNINDEATTQNNIDGIVVCEINSEGFTFEESPSDDNNNLEHVNINLEDIRINTLKMKRVGRPKGLEKTVIGLNKAKKCKTFESQTVVLQHKKIIKAIASNQDMDFINNILDSEKLIESSDFSISTINSMVFEPEVNINNVKKYFTHDGFIFLQKTLNKIKRKTYLCGICTNPVEKNSIRCDSCLYWIHFKCTGKKPSKNELNKKNWFCMNCKRSH